MYNHQAQISWNIKFGYSHLMVDLWFWLYIGVLCYKITHYLVSIIHIFLFYQPFGVQKLVTAC